MFKVKDKEELKKLVRKFISEERDINQIDISMIDDISDIFEGLFYDGPLTWDTSHIKKANYLFANGWISHPSIGDLDFRNLEEAEGMFLYTYNDHKIHYKLPKLRNGDFMFAHSSVKANIEDLELDFNILDDCMNMFSDSSITGKIKAGLLKDESAIVCSKIELN